MESFYNLACCYELQEKFGIASKWHLLATKLNSTMPEPYYGFALNQLKLGNPNDALRYLDRAIDLLGGSETVQRNEKLKYMAKYIRAICWRQLGNFEKSYENYQCLQKVIRIMDGKRICNNIFGMLMMPLE